MERISSAQREVTHSLIEATSVTEVMNATEVTSVTEAMSSTKAMKMVTAMDISIMIINITTMERETFQQNRKA